jgi:hypothetical protein
MDATLLNSEDIPDVADWLADEEAAGVPPAPPLQEAAAAALQEAADMTETDDDSNSEEHAPAPAAPAVAEHKAPRTLSNVLTRAGGIVNVRNTAAATHGCTVITKSKVPGIAAAEWNNHGPFFTLMTLLSRKIGVMNDDPAKQRARQTQFAQFRADMIVAGADAEQLERFDRLTVGALPDATRPSDIKEEGDWLLTSEQEERIVELATAREDPRLAGEIAKAYEASKSKKGVPQWATLTSGILGYFVAKKEELAAEVKQGQAMVVVMRQDANQQVDDVQVDKQTAQIGLKRAGRIVNGLQQQVIELQRQLKQREETAQQSDEVGSLRELQVLRDEVADTKRSSAKCQERLTTTVLAVNAAMTSGVVDTMPLRVMQALVDLPLCAVESESASASAFRNVLKELSVENGRMAEATQASDPFLEEATRAELEKSVQAYKDLTAKLRSMRTALAEADEKQAKEDEKQAKEAAKPGPSGAAAGRRSQTRTRPADATDAPDAPAAKRSKK